MVEEENKTIKDNRCRISDFIGLLFSIGIFIIGVLLILPMGSEIKADHAVNSLIFFALAIISLNFSNFSELHFSFGGMVTRIKKDKLIPQIIQNKKTIKDDDPQKGIRDKNILDNDRRISAKIAPSKNVNGYYVVDLFVKSTNESKPLTGEVKFFLHPTFPMPVQKAIPEKNIAHISILAWGAFTVGAEVENETTKLELDLNAIEGANEDFYG